MEAGDDSIDYAALDDGLITPDIKADAVKLKAISSPPVSYLPMWSKKPTTTPTSTLIWQTSSPLLKTLRMATLQNMILKAYLQILILPAIDSAILLKTKTPVWQQS